MTQSPNPAAIEAGLNQAVLDRAEAHLRAQGCAPAAPLKLDDFNTVTMWERFYLTTAGPFEGGIAGQGGTWFRITVISSPDVMIMFANNRFYGAAPMAAQHLFEKREDVFTQAELIQ